MIPNVSQQSLYPSLAAKGTSINTAISPPIPLSRRVINDVEEHQRRVLNSYAEGMNRGMNTSSIQSQEEEQEEQEEKITSTTKKQKATIIQAETQEETLQPGSLGNEDIGLNQADPTKGQDPTSIQAQEVEEKDVSVAEDMSDTQVQGGNTDLQAMMNSQIQRHWKTRYPEHRKSIIIKLPLMMMSKTIQYNLVIQLPNHSCQEVSEYPLQR